MPMKLFSPADSGFTLVFPAAFFPAEALELLVAEAVVAVLEVALPLGTPDDKLPDAMAEPRPGSDALGLTTQPFGVDVGQAGTVNPVGEAEYADKATPVGERVAHCAWRLVKSGETGVGVPWRVYPSTTLVPSVTSEPAKGP